MEDEISWLISHAKVQLLAPIAPNVNPDERAPPKASKGVMAVSFESSAVTLEMDFTGKLEALKPIPIKTISQVPAIDLIPTSLGRDERN